MWCTTLFRLDIQLATTMFYVLHTGHSVYSKDTVSSGWTFSRQQWRPSSLDWAFSWQQPCLMFFILGIQLATTMFHIIYTGRSAGNNDVLCSLYWIFRWQQQRFMLFILDIQMASKTFVFLRPLDIHLATTMFYVPHAQQVDGNSDVGESVWLTGGSNPRAN